MKATGCFDIDGDQKVSIVASSACFQNYFLVIADTNIRYISALRNISPR